MNRKTVLITGATRGIGWSLAQKAAQKGYRIILTGRDSHNLQKKAAELHNTFSGVEIVPVLLDVCDRLSLKQTAQKIGKIDFLINNAGIVADSWWTKMSLNEWDRVIATNLTGSFNVTHYFTPQINRGGQIIMLTSKSALFGNSGQANYTASKAGLIGLTKTLSKELAHFNLRINCVSPAARTDMTLPALSKLKERLKGPLPEEWQMGSSQEVANFIIDYLLEVPATGRIYFVNGKKIGYWDEPTFHQLN